MKKNTLKEFLLYIIVGAIATFSEWVVFFILDNFKLHHIIATITAYVISTFFNFLAGRLLVFKHSNKSLIKELVSIYIASIIGLLLNILIMFIAVDLLSVNAMLSKVIATLLVFIYNFFVRKKIIYNV